MSCFSCLHTKSLFRFMQEPAAAASEITSDEDSDEDSDDSHGRSHNRNEEEFAFGMDIEDDKRYDVAFDGCGIHTGLRIWSVEGMRIVDWPVERYGEFCDGNAYLVLQTTGESKGELHYNVHFWAGKHTKPDKLAVCAIKSTELATYLKKNTKTFREEQKEEDALFLSYFPDGISYPHESSGGGLRHIDTHQLKILYHIKGLHHPRISVIDQYDEHPRINHLINSGDVYVLDTNNMIFTWNGAHANFKEKAQGIQFALKLKSLQRRPVECEIVAVHEDREGNKDEKEDHALFWRAMGGRRAVMESKEDDEEGENVIVDLYRITEELDTVNPNDSNTTLQDKVAITLIETMSNGFLRRDMLDSSAVYFLNCDNELYVWVGKNAVHMHKAKQTAEAVCSCFFSLLLNFGCVNRLAVDFACLFFGLFFLLCAMFVFGFCSLSWNP